LPPNREASRKLLALSEAYVDRLSGQLVKGEISLADWQTEMRAEIRRSHALQLIAGHGGNKADVTDDDWLRLGSVVKNQYRFLSQFGRDIQSGVTGEGAISTRAQMYSGSSIESYWRAAMKGVDLPAYPCDGSTDCLTRCGCEWEKIEGAYYWRRGKMDSCDTCIEREGKWNPYQP
jgi:hypothetical protein